MTRRRTALRILAAIAAVAVVAGLAGAVLMPNETELARCAENALSDRLGVPVHIGRLHWQLLPVPMVEISDASTGQDDPVVLRRLTAWPRLGRLLHRELAFERVSVEGARIPQLSVREFKTATRPAPQDDGPLRLAELPLQRAEFTDLVWVGRHEIALSFDGHVDFDPGWRPREAAAWMPEAPRPARLDLHRIDGQDRWKADVAIADGSWNGTLVLQQPSPQRLRLTGEAEPRDIEVATLTETFKRRPVVAGRASGHTTLEAEGDTPGEMVQSLHTRTRFSAAPATVLRFDLDRAIRSLGKEHAGTTRLQSLGGTLDTRNDPDGIVMRYSDLEATSGALSASGTVVLQNRRIDAEIAVDLVDGVVGVPLKITGPVADPTFSVPPAAVAGAAVGTAVLPGVGTVLGARIGQTLGKIFGGSKPATGTRKAAPAPSGPPSAR